MTVTSPTTATSARDLVSSDLFDRLATRVGHEQQTDRGQAEHTVEQALEFLRNCADNPGVTLTPSKTADIGWHTFILDTHEYAAFCERVAGRFIHHVPTDQDATAGADCTQCYAGCHDSP